MISQDEMVSVISRILDGADLSRITGKSVRRKVMDELKDRVGNDKDAFKKIFQAALTSVLSGNNVVTPAKTPAKPSTQSPAEAHSQEDELELEKMDARKICSDEDGSVQEVGVSVKPRQIEKDSEKDTKNDEGDKDSPVEEMEYVPSVDEPIVMEDASGHDADDEDEEGKLNRATPRRRLTGKKRKAKVIVEGNDEDEIVPIVSHHPSNGDGAKSDGASVDDGSEEEEKGKSNPVRRARARPNMTPEERFEKLKRICKQLGCSVPNMRFRKKMTTAEKCALVVSSLVQKGVDVPNHIGMSKADIQAHRERLEREKELVGIDTSNIIEDGRSSRRTRGAYMPRPQTSGQLPSDLSGEELSDSSREDESDEYKASSEESE